VYKFIRNKHEFLIKNYIFSKEVLNCKNVVKIKEYYAIF